MCIALLLKLVYFYKGRLAGKGMPFATSKGLLFDIFFMLSSIELCSLFFACSGLPLTFIADFTQLHSSYSEVQVTT